jgi:hypothetical protein
MNTPFALGALPHYVADNQGHATGINPSVAIEYPKLERKFGKAPTYADNPVAHLRVELSFDVLQVARARQLRAAVLSRFHRLQGRKADSRARLSDTYSIQLVDIFSDLDLALGTYRSSTVIPEMMRSAWKDKKAELMKVQPA